jgi:hypothetical protein
MPAEWAAVDTLIRDLGAVSAAAYLRGSIEKATADLAVRDASEAVSRTFDAPDNPALLASARDAIQTAHDVIAALDVEVARSRVLTNRSVQLCGRAAELIEQARHGRG